MKIKYYDTHSHINLSPLSDNIDEIIEEMKKENTITNCIGVDLESSLSSIELARKYPNIVYSAIGIHPETNDYKNNIDFAINELEKMIEKYKDYIVCIGEIGLDYSYENLDKNYQQELFKKQIELAIKYNLPINIHNRESTDDLIEILKEYDYKKIMIHCFTLDYQQANRFLELGYMLSIPGVLTFKNKSLDSLRECIIKIPLDRLVIETDSPYLTPEPHRGKTNYPYYVKHVANKIAELKNMDSELVEKQLLNNALNFFNIKFI